MRTRSTILAACASALLLWASMPPVDLGALAWLALVPVASVALTAGGRAARAVVPLAYMLYLELLLVPALPFGLTDDQWGETPVPLLIGGSPVIVVALVAVPLLGLLLYALRFPQPAPGELGAGLHSFPWALAAVLVPAISWTALDFARVKLDPGGSWGPLFLSQHDTDAARLGALAGPWLITFAIVAVNYALALLVVRRRGALVPAAGLVAGVAVLVSVSPTPGTPAAALRVAAIQPGYDTAEFDRNRSERVLRYFRRGTYDLAALDLIRDLTPLTERARRLRAVVAVWPEAALWVDPWRTPAVRRALTRLARETNIAIVVPYFVDRLDQGATLVVTADGRLGGIQPKQRPMWFWGEDGGNRRPPMPVKFGAAGFPASVGTTLGVDNQDPRIVRLLARDGALLVTSSTHDWKQLAPTQQALAQLHAVESGVPLVRADWRYGSAIFDDSGKELADAGHERRRTVVIAGVSPDRSATTPYVELGDDLGWLTAGLTASLLGLTAALAGLSRFRASRAPDASPRRHRPAPSSPS